MVNIDLDGSVPELVVDYPPLLAVFQRLGIEYTCGGKSLRTACCERGLEPDAVVKECEAILQRENQ